MTPLELAQRDALRRCTFAVGSFDKRFMRDAAKWAPEHVVSAKGAATLQRLAHKYRRQIGRCLAAPCEVCAAPPAPAVDHVELGSQMGLFGGAA